MERFLKEYAASQKNAIRYNELMKKEIKSAALERIDGALNLRERGFITVNETVKLLLNAVQ